MPHNLRREVTGIALIALALFMGGALALQPLPLDTACTSARGIFGPVGGCLKGALLFVLGAPAATILAFIPLVHGLRLLDRMRWETDRRWLLFLAGLVVILPIVVGLATGTERHTDGPAGMWGGFVAFYLRRALGMGGAWLAVFVLASALTAWTLRWNPLTTRVALPRVAAGGTSPEALALEPPPEEMPAIEGDAREGGERRRAKRAEAIERAGAEHLAASESEGGGTAAPRKKAAKAKLEPLPVAQDSSPTVPLVEESDALEDRIPEAELLSPPPAGNVDVGRKEIDAMGVKLMEALRTFKVDGRLAGQTIGPVVTQFEVEPASGVKVRQFANLANDLALAMRAPSIRVVAPIPGRGAVGVEVPNPVPQIVSFRELIEAREFQQARMALPIALGKDLEGKVVVADLAKMPHLLIAGATGSGKSVCVNTIITSLVYRHKPDTLKFLMVDPKMVELSVYNDLPHLLHKVITDNRDAAYVLKWAVIEMQRRYELLAANGARNIQDFNKRIVDGGSLVLPTRPEVAFERREYTEGILPYVVVVIDELADLMMTVQGEVETPLAMLAQKARAIGIHIILATQRPSVNVITGLIKANFPSRIAFRVASQVDSRTIIDGMGAESLLGNGDMLFIPPGKSEPQRLQGAFIPGDDTERLMHWFDARRIAKRAARASKGLPDEELARPDIIAEVKAQEAIDNAEDGDGDVGGHEDRDPLFRKAAETCIQHQLGSTSLLQRRLNVGYGRAARIIDQLHAAGVLGPSKGSKPRDILIGLDELDRIAGPDDS
ncbi:MAG: DNA translocase FtsK 4TM domain-containing protein [Gemmatimonadaceae bacterium]|nr:DNA translocase FtsK 4TM domain-containing protein [Gemmatimonadaceae bacterium]